MKKHLILLPLIVGNSLSWAAPIPIETLPYMISKSGSYLLGKDLAVSTTGTEQNAITISANDVTLDLGGSTLSGPTQNKGGSPTTGIYVNSFQNVIIKNGTVRGFNDGINIQAAFTGIDSVQVVGYGSEGIVADGIFCNVSNCTVLGPAGTSNGSTGIDIRGGMSSVSSNTVREIHIGILVTNGGSGGPVTAYVLSGNSVVVPSGGTAIGIYLSGGASSGFVLGNEVLGGNDGISFDPAATGVRANNTVIGATTAYQGGTDGGGNQ